MSYTRYTFTTNIQNSSLQIGDKLWSAPISLGGTPGSFVGDKSTHNPDGVTQGQLSAFMYSGTQMAPPFNIGTVTDIGLNSVTVNSNGVGTGAGNFVFFEKDAKVNNATMTGHYLEVTMVNNSNKKAELFALSTEVAPSSK